VSTVKIRPWCRSPRSRADKIVLSATRISQPLNPDRCGSNRSRSRQDGVSSVIVGANDWAAAWAVDGQGRPAFAVVPGSEGQREIAMRFGVNLVMYVLTGNYKSDQVHVPAILERLGQ
jgi:hypothetical protein